MTSPSVAEAGRLASRSPLPTGIGDAVPFEAGPAAKEQPTGQRSVVSPSPDQKRRAHGFNSLFLRASPLILLTSSDLEWYVKVPWRDRLIMLLLRP